MRGRTGTREVNCGKCAGEPIGPHVSQAKGGRAGGSHTGGIAKCNAKG